ncbi:hypothetical protein HK100_008679, partial [Physocladia obscura]
MGARQSTMIKKNLSTNPPVQTYPDSVVMYDKSAPSISQTDGTKQSLSNPQSLKSETRTSKKYELKAAHVNTLVAKTWNPNDPKSWEPEMREYHALPDSDYMLPSDAAEQDRLEMQHYIYRAAYQG